MPTTTAVFKFAPESSQQALDQRIANFNAQPKPILAAFFAEHGVTGDNLVSDTVDAENGLRTVVRTWSDETVALNFLHAFMKVTPGLTDIYPGKIISAQVDPNS